MKTPSFFSRVGLILLLVQFMATPLSGQETTSPSDARELPGLWHARLRFGPDIRGPLTVVHDATGWRAEIAGWRVDLHPEGDRIAFELPEGRGGFRGQFVSSRRRIIGHWIQAATAASGSRYASPIRLERSGQSEVWRGDTDPLDDEFTMYLKVDSVADGTMRAFLKNPERNIGRWTPVASLERAGRTVRLRAKPRGGNEGGVLSEGTFAEGVLSLPLRGGTFDFERVAPDASSDFYPRGRPNIGAAYVYHEPTPCPDGWPVATPEDVGLSRPQLEKLVRALIDTPIDSLSSPEIHGVLVARHGKLVLEEYFHGEHRDKPHDTRSASKSVVAVLLGAAIESGVKLSAQSHVYEVMNGGAFPEGLEPRKRALTLEHLLTMSSGLDCDDNDPDSPGNEDKVAEQTEEPDLWKLTLALDMIRDPGERAVYCSIQPNLVGGVIRRASGHPLPEIFRDLVAEPMQIHRYWLNLMPTGEPYLGGGLRFLPRDFMKFGQLMLNGGTWEGRRVIPEAWAKRATSHLVDIGKQSYGYLWWGIDYPFQGRTVHGFYAGGNGGQVVMAIPELDLVIAFYGGNYADNVMFLSQRRLIPEYILPAVVGK
jgi:CubicO group peptidase (beta-lactamase class C family)